MNHRILLIGASGTGTSTIGKGVHIEAHLTLIIFLSASTEIRVQRIEQRERERHGVELLEGGKMHQIHQDFITWTKQYEKGGITGRTRERQEKWLSTLRYPILRIESSEHTDKVLGKILSFLKN